MRLLIVTNRNIVKRVGHPSWFGEGVNCNGACELRLAWANKKVTDGSWRVHLIREKRQDVQDNPPSKRVLKEYFEKLKKQRKACVLFVHGFNTSFAESLEQAHMISTTYGVGVILFSWPSNPGGSIRNEYFKAKVSAENSTRALDRTFEKICTAKVPQLSINLLIHSLGNYMFERFVRDPLFSKETGVFDNIILNAADVDLKGHKRWADKLVDTKHVYATLNEDDYVLAWSQFPTVNLQRRLGNATWRLESRRLIYFDLTAGKGVDGKHEHFGETAEANTVVKEFFRKALRGEKSLPLNGATCKGWKNAYVLDEVEEGEEWNQ